MDSVRSAQSLEDLTSNEKLAVFYWCRGLESAISSQVAALATTGASNSMGTFLMNEPAGESIDLALRDSLASHLRSALIDSKNQCIPKTHEAIETALEKAQADFFLAHANVFRDSNDLSTFFASIFTGLGNDIRARLEIKEEGFAQALRSTSQWAH